MKTYDVYTAKVGDKITASAYGSRIQLTVRLIIPAGASGEALSRGPKVWAHVRSWGYSISFDADSVKTYRVTPGWD